MSHMLNSACVLTFIELKYTRSMNKNSNLIKRITDFLYDHYKLKQVLEVFRYLFFALVSAFIFAFGFTAFISPPRADFIIATGGVSGVSQIVARILSFFGVEVGDNIVHAVFYTVLNIPLIIFSFLKIGKKFTIFTTVNVVASTIFIWLLSKEGGVADYFAGIQIAEGKPMIDSILGRILFGAICTGVSSATAFVGGISCGGIDIVTYYLGMRTSSQLGKYSAIINVFIFSTFSLLGVFGGNNSFGYAMYSILYSCLYCLIVALVVDLINLKNKKVRIEIITTTPNMGDILISNFPHGATIEHAQGVYSKKDKYVVLMTVSSTEYKKVLAIARKVDPLAFISVFSVVQVYGNFYSKPVE